MTRNNLFLMIILLAYSFLSAGCLQTQVPPFTQADIITDDKMLGRWFPIAPKTDEEPPIYTVIPKGDNLYQLLIQENGRESLAQLTLFKLNNQTYLSVSYTDSEEYDMFQYYWDDDALKLKGFDHKQFIDLSKKEKLDIEYTINDQNMMGSIVSFDTTTERLRNFLQEHGTEIFSDQGGLEMKRLDE